VFKYAFALYKLAWCQYNVGEYGKGIDTMKAVVSYSMTAQDAGSKSKLTLQDEALKDLVRFFADAGEMDEAYGYFTKLGKKDLIRKMLTRLASTYFEQGKFEQCIQTYRRLIAEDPQSSKAPDYQNEIIQAYQKIGRKQDTLNEIKRLLDSYGKNSAWARANSADQDAITEATKYIEKSLRTVAINNHNDAKKLGTGRGAREAYDLAEKAYTVYLQEFPTSKYSYDIRYAFGELLYKLKKYDQAYEQYMTVVKTDPKGKHSRFCAESAIFAADKMIAIEKKAGRIPKAKTKTERLEMVQWEKNLLAACDQWSRIFPDDKKTRNILYKSAYTLYNKNQFKEASDRFRTVIGMNPSSKEAEQAANLILDSFNLVSDWKNLKDVSKAFYDQKGLGRASFKKSVYNIYERASFKLIEVNLEQDKDQVKAATAFMAFYDEFPKSEVADTALNNAAVYYHQQKEPQKAMDTRLILVGKFPKSKYYNDTIAELGFDYENIADFESAAGYYEQLFNLDKEHKAAKDAIYSAALFQKAMGNSTKAIKNYQSFIKTFPDDERITDIRLTIGKILEKHEKWPEVVKLY
jgi:tetratricopeptide (TPR) repeat protein